MDIIWASGAQDLGSIPSGATKKENEYNHSFSFYFSLFHMDKLYSNQAFYFFVCPY